ncbi:MAG: hypothetical protein ACLTKG_00285 [Collinsella intestinalis]
MPVICEVFGRRSVEYVMDGAPAGAPPRRLSPLLPRPRVPRRRPRRRPQAAPVSAASAVRLPDGRRGPTASRAATSAPAAPSRRGASRRPFLPPPPRRPPRGAVADHASGPTVLAERDIDADRKAWEDDMPPYDDAFIASYDDAEVPPFDVPAPAP